MSKIRLVARSVEKAEEAVAHLWLVLEKEGLATPTFRLEWLPKGYLTIRLEFKNSHEAMIYLRNTDKSFGRISDEVADAATVREQVVFLPLRASIHLRRAERQ